MLLDVFTYLLIFEALFTDAWITCGRRSPPCCRHFKAAYAAPSGIDFQSDSEKYGRGDRHLSAILNEGDVVVYQTGCWTVDGVVVGEDTLPPTIQYALVDTIQVVWTHNCEHGVIRGMELKFIKEERVFTETGEAIEFGPEQLIARLPVELVQHQVDDQETNQILQSFVPLVEISDGLWKID